MNLPVEMWLCCTAPWRRLVSDPMPTPHLGSPPNRLQDGWHTGKAGKLGSKQKRTWQWKWGQDLKQKAQNISGRSLPHKAYWEVNVETFLLHSQHLEVTNTRCRINTLKSNGKSIDCEFWWLAFLCLSILICEMGIIMVHTPQVLLIKGLERCLAQSTQWVPAIVIIILWCHLLN